MMLIQQLVGRYVEQTAKGAWLGVDNRTTLKQASKFVADAINLARQQTSDQHLAELYFGSDSLRVICPSQKLASIIVPTLQFACNNRVESDSKPWTVYALSAKDDGFFAPPSEWDLQCDDQELITRSMWRPDQGFAISSDESRGIWHLMHLPSRIGLYWVRSVDGLPIWELGSPLRHHIHWLCMMSKKHMLHGAVVGEDDWGALLVGPGGSGKSTLTAAAVVAGLNTVGDDLVALEKNDKDWIAHAIYDVVKLTGMAEDVFRSFLANAINPERNAADKALVPISSIAKTQFKSQLPVNVVFSCGLSYENTSKIERTSAFDIIRSLSPATSKVLRTGLRETFQSSAQVAGDLPCFRIKIGKDPAEAVDCLSSFMKQKAYHG